MTQQIFTVGQSIIRVAPSCLALQQGTEYLVELVYQDGMIKLSGEVCLYDSHEFRPASNIKPIPTEDTPVQDNEINELRNLIVALETELGDTKEGLAQMNQWWYEEKTKGEALKELVVKQATQMMA